MPIAGLALASLLALTQAAPIAPPPSAPAPATAPATAPPPASTAPPAAPPPTYAPPPGYPPGYPPPAARVTADTYATAQAIEARTGLDMSDPWRDYVEDARLGERLLDFTRKRFRRKMIKGIVLTGVGAALAGAGMALVLVSADRVDADDEAVIDVVGGALLMTAGLGMLIPGTIIWPLNQIRLKALRRAEAPQALRLRPLALPRGAGLGLALDF